MKSIEKIYQYIKTELQIDDLKSRFNSDAQIGISAYDIERELGVVRNNASTILNKLWRDGKLIKIISRPVTFIATSLVQDCNWPLLDNNEYTYEQFKTCLSGYEEFVGTKDNFETLIGSDQSLKNQVEQAKAAIMYPTHGLHTLIIGNSGVGKTTFANIMYEYARVKKELPKDDFPFISFNCSDYYSNPQLLMSQLFGHRKGAFTGAVQDKIGLVEKADHGILFLDEIHRLPPEGQEMLFFLIDRNEFHRLGETETKRKSQVLIIGATTEDPEEVLLHTFRRRLPVVIKMPSLEEKKIGERVELIEKIFLNESIRLKQRIVISPEVIKALSIYKCPGNIGQLVSDIKMICAKAFLDYLKTPTEIKVEFSMLSKNIKESIFKIQELDANVQDYLKMFTGDLTVYPTNEHQSFSYDFKDDIYQILSKKINEYRKLGFNEEEIYDKISEDINSFYAKVIDDGNFESMNIRELYKIINHKVVDISVELLQKAPESLKSKFSKKLLFGVAFHIQSLLERLNHGEIIFNPDLIRIKSNYPDEFEYAKTMVRELQERFSVDIPYDEKGFLALLLAHNKEVNDHEDRVGLLIISHGISTATSMTNVCNRLMNTDFAKAIDLPLADDVEEIYRKTLTSVKMIDRGKGVLLLVDMGSLTHFGDRIMNDTGIKVCTVDNVSTPMILELLRKIIYRNESLEQLQQSAIQLNQHADDKDKKDVIITVCATGQGASLMVKNLIQKLFVETNHKSIEVVALDYQSIEGKKKEYLDVVRQFKIIACVGNIEPNLDVRFFSLSEIMNPEKKMNFINYIDATLGNGGSVMKADQAIKDVYQRSEQLLMDYVLFVNPRIAVEQIKRFVDDIRSDFELDDENLINLIIHIGCMLDRIVKQEYVIYEGKDLVICKTLYKRIKEAMSVIEKFYKIDIPEDEVCYVIKILNSI